MNFKEAIDKLIEGKKLKRLSWGEKSKVYIFLDEGIVSIFNKTGVGYSFVLGIAELKAEDWTIFEE